MNEIKTLEERENSLIAKGKEKGFITFEELALELKGLEVDSDDLDNLDFSDYYEEVKTKKYGDKYIRILKKKD